MRVCISGGGVAGYVVAYFLSKLETIDIVVLERSESLEATKLGQGIDIAGPAREVIRKMGLEEKILSQVTKEAGLAFVDERNTHWGVFDVGDEKTDVGFTKEIEINRGVLVKILYEAATSTGKNNVDVRFGSFIETLKQTDNKVTVTIGSSIGKSSSEEEFDVLIGADGLGSKTRKLILSKEENQQCYKPVGVYTAFFDIPREDQDWPRGRFYNISGRRAIAIRPRNDQVSSAYLTIVTEDPELDAASRNGPEEQKLQMQKRFQGCGWESDRVLKSMNETEKFYFSPIAQIKISGGSWSRSRVVLLGDAACSPSPLTGFGTTSAIIGSYVLAGELSKVLLEGTKDPRKALEAYEKCVRPYLEQGQQIPLGGRVVYLVNPQTSLGTKFLRLVTYLVSWSGIIRFLGDFEPAPFDLPEYPALEQK